MISNDNRIQLVLIGGSAGSIQVILETLKNLNPDLGFPIVLVLHRKAQAVSILPKLFQQYSENDVIEIEDKIELQNNKIYIVPSDYHLLFENKKLVSLDSSEKMNYSRPSLDVAFKSAAEVFGCALVGVILSGANADGVEGLRYIKENNGKVWIQDPADATVDYMPRHALQDVSHDLIITQGNLAAKINQLKTNKTI